MYVCVCTNVLVEVCVRGGRRWQGKWLLGKKPLSQIPIDKRLETDNFKTKRLEMFDLFFFKCRSRIGKPKEKCQREFVGVSLSPFFFKVELPFLYNLFVFLR